MNNKTNIEEDIIILKDKDILWNYPEARVLQLIENILTDRERLQAKANAYDRLVKKIEDFIKEKLPNDEICTTCDIYDVNGVEIKKRMQEL